MNAVPRARHELSETLWQCKEDGLNVIKKPTADTANTDTNTDIILSSTLIKNKGEIPCWTLLIKSSEEYVLLIAKWSFTEVFWVCSFVLSLAVVPSRRLPRIQIIDTRSNREIWEDRNADIESKIYRLRRLHLEATNQAHVHKATSSLECSCRRNRWSCPLPLRYSTMWRHWRTKMSSNPVRRRVVVWCVAPRRGRASSQAPYWTASVHDAEQLITCASWPNLRQSRSSRGQGKDRTGTGKRNLERIQSTFHRRDPIRSRDHRTLSFLWLRRYWIFLRLSASPELIYSLTLSYLTTLLLIYKNFVLSSSHKYSSILLRTFQSVTDLYAVKSYSCESDLSTNNLFTLHVRQDF